MGRSIEEMLFDLAQARESHATREQQIRVNESTLETYRRALGELNYAQVIGSIKMDVNPNGSGHDVAWILDASYVRPIPDSTAPEDRLDNLAPTETVKRFIIVDQRNNVLVFQSNDHVFDIVFDPFTKSVRPVFIRCAAADSDRIKAIGVVGALTRGNRITVVDKPSAHNVQKSGDLYIDDVSAAPYVLGTTTSDEEALAAIFAVAAERLQERLAARIESFSDQPSPAIGLLGILLSQPSEE